MVYCESTCYDADTYTDWQIEGYDDSVAYSPVYKYVDYDAGQNGGQFMYVVYADGWNAY